MCVCVCVEHVCVRSHVCGCSVKTLACFSTFWLSGALRSQAGEWRGHIRGIFRAPTHHAPTILPPCSSHQASLSPSRPLSPVIPSPPPPTRLPLVVTGWVGHSGGRGTGTQGASVADSRQVGFLYTPEEEGQMRADTSSCVSVWGKGRKRGLI